jgi:glycosyltransferase involved in cell wall biosynthesis
VWIGGERDELFYPARVEAQRLGLEEVRFTGNVVDVSPWLACADVLVHPARLDSFPLVCLHAAGAGTPVVAFSGVGGVPEMFGPEFCGVAYPDVVGLSEVVRSLADPSRRAAVGAAQQRRVLERYVADVGGPPLREQLVRAAAAHHGSSVR